MKDNLSSGKRGYPWLYLLAALLSLGGLADSIYLTVTHLTGENVVCVASSGCNEVLGSAYATVGKFPWRRLALSLTSSPSVAQRSALLVIRAREFF